MKIREIRVVTIDVPKKDHSAKSRGPAWVQHVRAPLPMQKYKGYPGIEFKMPSVLENAVWVQVIAEDGTWGLGRASFGPTVASVIEKVYAPLLVGQDCMAIEFLNDLMWRAIQRLGSSGHATIAQSGVDLALWDLKGKLLDQPVYRLLGGPCRPSIPLYSTSDDLGWTLELGFQRCKISNPAYYEDGIEGLNSVEAHVAQARETVGDSIELMINPVMSYNVQYAIQVAERLRPFNLRWLEEPLLTTDVRGHLELKRSVPWMPIATGEDHHGRHAFAQLIDNRCVDIVQPDLSWCGGLTEALKIYTLAEAAGIPTILHVGGSTPFGQHFSIAMPECPMAEYWLASDPGVPLADANDIPGMPTPIDGVVTPSDAPGFGMEFKEEQLGPYQG